MTSTRVSWVKFEDSNGSKVTRIAVVGSMRDSGGRRQRGQACRSACGYQARLGRSFARRLGKEHYGATAGGRSAAPPEVLATLGRGFAAVVRDRRHSVPAAMATWPTAVQALAHSFTPLVPRGFAP